MCHAQCAWLPHSRYLTTVWQRGVQPRWHTICKCCRCSLFCAPSASPLAESNEQRQHLHIVCRCLSRGTAARPFTVLTPDLQANLPCPVQGYFKQFTRVLRGCYIPGYCTGKYRNPINPAVQPNKGRLVRITSPSDWRSFLRCTKCALLDFLHILCKKLIQ